MTPQIVALLASTGVGVWMVVAGVEKRALEWTRRKRICPSCGHDIIGRTCGRHV
jgi:NADH pyrophosphatase NudC (nudix superfamily)